MAEDAIKPNVFDRAVIKQPEFGGAKKDDFAVIEGWIVSQHATNVPEVNLAVENGETTIGLSQMEPQDQLVLMDKLQKDGLVKVREATLHGQPEGLGIAVSRTNSVLRSIFPSYTVPDTVNDSIFKIVDSSASGSAGVAKHNWFKEEFVAGDDDYIQKTIVSSLVKAWEQSGDDYLSKAQDKALEILLQYKNKNFLSGDDIDRANALLGRKDPQSLSELFGLVLSKKFMVMTMVEGADKYDNTGNMCKNIEIEALETAVDRKNIGDQLVEVAHDFEPLYKDELAPVYVDFAQTIIERVGETGRKMVFLFRDGQFLRKLVKTVAKESGQSVDSGLLQEGFLSRTVMLDHAKERDDFTRIVGDLIIGSGARNSQNMEVADLANEFLRLGDRSRFSNKLTSQEFTKIMLKNAEAQALIAEKLLDIGVGDFDQNLLESAKKIGASWREKMGILDEYLDSLGAFEPFFDMADTGVVGSIMEYVARRREAYFVAHENDPDFINKLKLAYKSENDLEGEDLKSVYDGTYPLDGEQGYSLRTYMLATSRNLKSGNYFVDGVNRGSVHATIATNDLRYWGYDAKSASVGLEGSAVMDITHVIESRLNGYMEPLKRIERDGNGGFVVIHDETRQDLNENVDTMFAPKKRKESSFGAKGDITDDIGRRSLNFAAMRFLLSGVKKETQRRVMGGNLNLSAEQKNQNVKKAADAVLNISRPMYDLIRMKTPTRDSLEQYFQMKETM